MLEKKKSSLKLSWLFKMLIKGRWVFFISAEMLRLNVRLIKIKGKKFKGLIFNKNQRYVLKLEIKPSIQKEKNRLLVIEKKKGIKTPKKLVVFKNLIILRKALIFFFKENIEYLWTYIKEKEKSFL